MRILSDCDKNDLAALDSLNAGKFKFVNCLSPGTPSSNNTAAGICFTPNSLAVASSDTLEFNSKNEQNSNFLSFPPFERKKNSPPPHLTIGTLPILPSSSVFSSLAMALSLLASAPLPPARTNNTSAYSLSERNSESWEAGSSGALETRSGRTKDRPVVVVVVVVGAAGVSQTTVAATMQQQQQVKSYGRFVGMP